MNKHANILFIPTSLDGINAEPQHALSQQVYYQQLIRALFARSSYTTEGFQILGRQLATIARHACLAKRMDTVEQASQLMLALPISNQLESIARHYQALCTWRQGDSERARQSLTRVAEEASPQYRARALHIIGLTHHEHGDLEEALRFYLASGKAADNCDLPTLIESQRMTAAVRGTYGDHKRALADLEKLFPAVSAITKYYPVLYYEFLNSLSVEFGEVGRVEEAKAACEIALASPFASAYPEWRETRQDLEAKSTSSSPSVVAINRALEPDPATQVQTRSEPKLVTKVALTYPLGDKDFFQRSKIKFPATATMNLHAGSILDRTLICIRPRAPPALS